MQEQHQQHLHKPIYGGALKNTHPPRKEEEETMHRKRDISSHYGLRQNPKKTTHASFELESSEPRKILFRCGECGKGFRYEKCLSNHQAGAHLSTIQRVCEESIKSLCGRFSLVRKKKRSRVFRYKKTSFTTFLEPSSAFDDENDEELEVAECLILLSKSSPKIVVDGGKLVGEETDAVTDRLNGFLCYKKVRKAAEFEYGFLSNEQKLLEEGDSFLGIMKQRRAREFNSGISSYEAWTETVRFLGHKGELDQWKLSKSEPGVGAMECSVSDDEIVTESVKGDDVHQCKLCNKMFSSYQARGGHQTSHRMNKSKSKKSSREEIVEEPEDDESVKEEKKMQRKCSKLFKDVSCSKQSMMRLF